ncbi:MAG: hypothetical protein HYS32_03250 [Candidatus Woesearchaeota archaeon]|nr:MAG: hypothetical protein HYS32_03250 [Candidatus Woesearchaeota archaeon]
MNQEILKKLEGLQTVETMQKELNLTKQSTINLISKLKKQGYLTIWLGGGNKKRMYKISQKKQRLRDPGMFDIINKYSPHMKLSEWYDHQVHGTYGPEEALIEALQTKSFRVISASMFLFNHITNWPKLYKIAKEKNCWQKVGALYDVAKMFFKVRKMPLKYRKQTYKNKQYLIRDYETKEKNFILIEKKWKVPIPFRMGDIHKVKYDNP